MFEPGTAVVTTEELDHLSTIIPAGTPGTIRYVDPLKRTDNYCVLFEVYPYETYVSEQHLRAATESKENHS